jgi:hypothetical protein
MRHHQTVGSNLYSNSFVTSFFKYKNVKILGAIFSFQQFALFYSILLVLLFNSVVTCMSPFAMKNELNSEQVEQNKSNQIKQQDEIYLDLHLNSNQIELVEKLQKLLSEQSVNFSNNKSMNEDQDEKTTFKHNVTLNDLSTFNHLSPTQLVQNLFKLFLEYKLYFLIIFLFVVFLFVSFLTLFYTFYAIIKQKQNLMKNKRIALSFDVIDNVTRLNNSKQYNSQNLIEFFKVFQSNKTSLMENEVENKTLSMEHNVTDNVMSKSNENFYNFSFLSQERTIEENGQPTNSLKFQTFCVKKN